MKLDLSRLVNVKRNPTDQSIQCQCPICASEDGRDLVGRNHLRVYQSGGFRCIVNDDRVHNAKIRAYLRGTNPDENPDYEYIDPEPARISVEKVYPEETLSKLVPDYSYWVGRGIKPEVLARLEGGMAPEDEKSKLSARFIFPCRNIDGRIIGYSARLTFNNSFAPKWKIIGKKSLFIMPSVSISKPAIQETGTVILVEGIGCCLKLGERGIFNTLCLFGLNISGRQISYIVSTGARRVVIATNNEDSGIGNQAAERLKTKLCAFFSEENVVIHLPYSKDFMEMSEEKIAEWHQSLQKPCI